MIIATINVYLFAMGLLYINGSDWFGLVALTLVLFISIIFLGPVETKKDDAEVATGEGEEK